MNLASDDVHVAPRVRVDLAHFFAQQLEVNHDRVDGIFYFRGNAGGEPPNGRQTAGQFNFVLDSANRFGVAHGEKRADALAALGDEIERNLYALSVLQFDLTLRDGLVQSKSIQHDAAQLVGIVEYLLHHVSRSLSRSEERRVGKECRSRW